MKEKVFFMLGKAIAGILAMIVSVLATSSEILLGACAIIIAITAIAVALYEILEWGIKWWLINGIPAAAGALVTFTVDSDPRFTLTKVDAGFLALYVYFGGLILVGLIVALILSFPKLRSFFDLDD